MRMLRRMCEATREDRIEKEYIRGTTKMEVSKKAQEGRLRWYGHILRREEDHVGKQTMEMEVQGRRKRGRPKKRWIDCVKEDLRTRNIDETDVYNRTRWRRLIRTSDPV